MKEGLCSLTASASVMFVFEAWMSSRDGAVMRIVGGSEEWLVEFDSVLDCEAAVIEGPKVLSINKEKLYTTNTHHLTANMSEMHINLNNNSIQFMTNLNYVSICTSKASHNLITNLTLFSTC